MSRDLMVTPLIFNALEDAGLLQEIGRDGLGDPIYGHIAVDERWGRRMVCRLAAAEDVRALSRRDPHSGLLP